MGEGEATLIFSNLFHKQACTLHRSNAKFFSMNVGLLGSLWPGSCSCLFLKHFEPSTLLTILLVILFSNSEVTFAISTFPGALIEPKSPCILYAHCFCGNHYNMLWLSSVYVSCFVC